jgi:hypothetical protein
VDVETIVMEEEEDDSEVEEEVLTRRSGRDRRLTKRYIERDSDEDEEKE